MCGRWVSSTCRVCLASDREMYRLANTALEETYERVTSDTLVVEGRPCCVCGVCLSALRRCRRFIDTAREANIALDRWIRNQPDSHSLELTERPLFTLTRSPTEVLEFTCQESVWEPEVKQESDTAENEDSNTIHQQNKITSDVKNQIRILTDEIKDEVKSDDEGDNTLAFDDECVKIQESEIGKNHNSEVISNFVCVNVRENLIDDGIEAPAPKLDYSKLLDNVGGETDPGTSKVRKKKTKSLQENVPLKRTRKRVKPKEDTKYNPKGHLKQHSITYPEKPFACDRCEYRCRDNSMLKLHLMRHTGERPFSCDKCDYRCIKRESLKEHIKIHTGEKPFNCDQCDFRCARKTTLKIHLITHSGQKRLLCDRCDYRCIHIGQLEAHIRSHTGEKPFACNKCDFKCSRKTTLAGHLKTHSGKKPFACDKCDYKCLHKRSLSRHKMIHTGEKPHACDKCDYRCIQKVQLLQHLRTHTGEKPYTCDKCDYNCSFKSVLKTHMRSHTGGTAV